MTNDNAKKIDVRPWEILSSSRALEEKWFPVRKDVVKLPSGKTVNDYFVWESPNIVTIVPVTPEGSFILVRQYRHAIGKVVYQFPAGATNKDEEPKSAAKRELEEETGYVCRELIHLATLTPYATKMTGIDDVFIGLDAVPDGKQEYDEQEESEPVVKTIDELFALMQDEAVTMTQLPASLLLALHYLKKI